MTNVVEMTNGNSTNERTVYTDAMVDLETFGLSSNAPIITIGIVLFNAYLDNPNQVMLRRTFKLDIQDLFHKGFLPDAGTIAFWLKQPESARLGIVEAIEDTESLYSSAHATRAIRAGHNIHVLGYEIPSFLQENCILNQYGDAEMRIWGNDSLFDIGKLQAHYEADDIGVPWPWWNVRCYRTEKDNSGIPLERIGTLHNACDDAETQARHLVKILME